MIRTKRLEIMPINIEHSEALLDLWNNYNIIKYTYATQISTIEEAIDRVNFFISKNQSNDFINNFTILLNGEPIGIIGIPTISFDRKDFGFYYQIREKYWNKGYGYEAAKGFLDYINSSYNINTLYATVVPENPASISILNKLGFKMQYTMESGFNHNGFNLDVIHFKYSQNDYSFKGNNIILEKAEVIDISDLLAIQKSSFKEDYKRFGYCPAFDATLDSMNKTIKIYTTYKIIYNKVLVGQIRIKETEPNTYYIGCFGIIPKYQNKNIGQDVFKLIKNKYPNAKTWQLETPFEKKGNLHFYNKLGFEIIKHYYDGPVELVLLQFSEEIRVNR